VLKLRRGKVVSYDPLIVKVGNEERRAWADVELVGRCLVGDDVVVNTEAKDLGLGSGGFDIVHVNLTRGLDAPGSSREHVMKLNYTSLQHPVGSIERSVPGGEAGEPDAPGDHADAGGLTGPSGIPVLAIGLHGHLAPAAWAAGEVVRSSGRELKVAYVQTGGGALPGSFSRDVAELRERGLIFEHVTAGPAYGGGKEAITLVGALDAAGARGWDAVIAGPGPGILGSATNFGHGGMTALDVLHGALALGMPALLSPRISAGDPRPRHQGLSHHSLAVLELLLAGVEVPVPEGNDEIGAIVNASGGGDHSAIPTAVDLGGYEASGLPIRSMGRDISDDPVFFAAPLAAGRRLAEVAAASTF